MAGHSKWANIKHKKAKEDAKKGQVFSKISKKITTSARHSGGDINLNTELRMLVQKAREANMPGENIERAIKKGTGELEGVKYEEFNYEGYGPSGVAMYVELMSDNRNRTAAEIRHLFSKHGGNLGESGCVAWMFTKKGQIIIDGSEKPLDEDELLLTVLEAGAEDVEFSSQLATVYTDPTALMEVREKLLEYSIVEAEIAMIPNNPMIIDDLETAKRVVKLMDLLEDHDDVQAVFANFDISTEVMEDMDS